MAIVSAMHRVNTRTAGADKNQSHPIGYLASTSEALKLIAKRDWEKQMKKDDIEQLLVCVIYTLHYCISCTH